MLCLLKKLEFYSPSIRTQSTIYTETPIKTYLEQFADQLPLTETEEELDNIIICEECQLKINDYDLACSTARNIENDLRDLLKKSKELIIKHEIDIKIECDDMIDEDKIDDFEETSSDEEKPLIRIKKERKNEIKSKENNEGGQKIVKKRGRPRILNKPKIRRVKSSIPDSEVPPLLKCSVCGLQMRAIVAYKVFSYKNSLKVLLNVFLYKKKISFFFLETHANTF